MNSRNFLGVILCAILVLATNSAAVQGQIDPAASGLPAGNGEDSRPSFSETTADQPPGPGGEASFGQSCCSPWTASAEFIIFERIGTVSQALVSTYPPHDPIILGTGTERLDSNDLDQGFSGGPRLDLMHHGDDGCDLEFSFFQIDGWSSAKKHRAQLQRRGRAAAQLAGVHGSRRLRPNNRLSRSGHGMELCDEPL